MSYPSNIKKCKYCNCPPEIDEIPIIEKDNLPFYKHIYILFIVKIKNVPKHLQQNLIQVKIMQLMLGIN